MRSLSFEVPGRLGSWNRAGRNTAQGITYTPKAMRSDQAMLRVLASQAMRKAGVTQMTGPLAMIVRTYRQPPQSWSKTKRAAARWITSKPDFDNTLKLIADALNCVVYHDDAQIADGRHLKLYDLERAEGVTIELWELEQQ